MGFFMFFRGTKQYSGRVYYSTMSPWRAPQIATATSWKLEIQNSQCESLILTHHILSVGTVQ